MSVQYSVCPMFSELVLFGALLTTEPQTFPSVCVGKFELQVCPQLGGTATDSSF